MKTSTCFINYNLWVWIAFYIVISCSPKKNHPVESIILPETNILQSTNASSLTNQTFQSTPERLKRGEYLTNGILQCFTCHAERDSSQAGAPPIEAKKGGGAILWAKDRYRIVAPNISSDLETGAGTWTDDMFARAIREGVGHDGRVLSMMFWPSFRIFQMKT
jgi:hypothetical protein